MNGLFAAHFLVTDQAKTRSSGQEATLFVYVSVRPKTLLVAVFRFDV